MAELAAAGAGAAAFAVALAAAHARARDELRVVRRLVVALRVTLLALGVGWMWLLADEWGARVRGVWRLGPVRPAALLALWLPIWHAPWHWTARWLALGALPPLLVAGVVASQDAGTRVACTAAGTCLSRGGPTVAALLVVRGRELALVGLASAGWLTVAYLALALGCAANAYAPRTLARRKII
jgi:hypothetical protein